MNYCIRTKLLVVFLLAIGFGSVQADVTQKSWHFRVFLDESEIGRHTFDLRKQNDKTFVSVKANFDVKILFFSVYTYEHQNHETWKDNCLESIRSRTDDNGDIFYLRGESLNHAIRVETESGSDLFEGCVKTFSYWDPDFLNSSYLLNAQTGDLEQVIIENIGKATILVKGENVNANHYRVQAEEFNIDLWYSVNDREWLALKSTTRDGAVLQYEKI